MAATLLFLSITFKGLKVDGESTASGYEKLIEIESFSWEMSAQHKYDKQTTKVRTISSPRVLELSKFVDLSSMTLSTHMKNQEKFSIAVLTFAQYADRAANSRKVMEIVLRDGFVEDLKIDVGAGSKSMAVKETVSLSYDKLELKYFPQASDLRARSGFTDFKTSQPCAK